MDKYLLQVAGQNDPKEFYKEAKRLGYEPTFQMWTDYTETAQIQKETTTYMVFIQDEWNNNHYIGLFYRLKDAIPGINNFLKDYNISVNSLEKYPSTFGECFDKEVWTKDKQTCIYIRGFILTKEDLENVR